ncbi:MAG: hypothetical protein M3P34_08900 [Actinomycetota bacterium]|nr:hypothetical protein [Actinomycetota bacterium]
MSDSSYMIEGVAESYGISVERRRREIAAHHGVPDFVFRPAVIAAGSGHVEVGDFLLWVGDVVAIVSSKSRAPEAAATETQDRRRRWFERNIEEAYGQVRGTFGTLTRAEPGSIVLVSERGVQVPWDPSAVWGYIGVIVVDAPPPDEDFAPPVMTDRIPTLAMLGDDWDALNFVLPSTMALIRYLGRRVMAIPRCPMGAELDVLALILEHENTGEPIAIPEEGLPRGHFESVAAAHPDWFLGGHSDDRFALVIDSMIEAAADADPAYSTAAGPLVYMKIVEFLDRIPLLSRVSIGKAVVERCERVGREGGRITTYMAVPHGLLVVVIDDQDRPSRAEWLRGVVFARHSQLLDAGAPSSVVTLGVGTQPLPSSGGRSHDFVLLNGGIRSDPQFRQERDALYGAKDLAVVVAQLDL